MQHVRGDGRLATLSLRRTAQDLRGVHEQGTGPQRIHQNEWKVFRRKAGFGPLLLAAKVSREGAFGRPARSRPHLIMAYTNL